MEISRIITYRLFLNNGIYSYKCLYALIHTIVKTLIRLSVASKRIEKNACGEEL